MAAEVCLVGGSIYGALPMAIAVFPQEMVIPVSSLEPEFRDRKDKAGQPITEVHIDRGRAEVVNQCSRLFATSLARAGL